MGCVYMATNIDKGLSYIGKTTRTLPKRQYEHFKWAEGGSDLYFHRAIRMHGKDSFEWVILYESADDVKLCSVERKFIEYYDTASPNGYNLTYGGDGVRSTAEVTAKKSKSISERYANDSEYVKRRQAGIDKYYAVPENRAKVGNRAREQSTTESWKSACKASWSPERRAKASEKMSRRMEEYGKDEEFLKWRAERSKAAITPESIEKTRQAQIKRYSDPEYRKAYAIKMQKQAHDPVWLEKTRRGSIKRARPVICVETGEYFLMARAAADRIGCDRRAVNAVVQKRQKSTRGFSFRYATQEEINTHKENAL